MTLATPPLREIPLAGAPGPAVALLAALPPHVYALLDAARDPAILALLRQAGQPYQSLYDGDKGDELADVAPYLVEVRPGTPFVDTLLGRSWGRGWGLFLSSGDGFADVRRHFRRFLIVRAEDGRELYFRFYDPRVLPTFLATCEPAESAAFFGPVARFVVEAEGGRSMLVLSHGEGGTVRATVPLGDGDGA